MIKVFDAAAEEAKCNEQRLKELNNKTVGKDKLTMNLILKKKQQNRHEKKMEKIRTIESRKLRIKIKDIFKTIISSNKKRSISMNVLQNPTDKIVVRNKNDKSLSQRKLNSQKKYSNESIFMKKQTNQLPSVPQRSYPIYSQVKINDKQSQKQLGRELISLFDRFTDQELEEIQSYEQYYLCSSEIIDLFHKFMTRRRMSKKDYSYDKFMIKGVREKKEQLNIEQMSTEEAKKYIACHIKSLAKSNEKIKNLHLLTDPLQIISRQQSKYSQKASKNLKSFKQLKKLQESNNQKLQQAFQKKLLEQKIANNYYNGIVFQNRAALRDEKKKEIQSRNALDSKKSNQFRARLKVLDEAYGSLVEMAENMRVQFLKNMGKKQRVDIWATTPNTD